MVFIILKLLASPLGSSHLPWFAATSSFLQTLYLNAGWPKILPNRQKYLFTDTPERTHQDKSCASLHIYMYWLQISWNPSLCTTFGFCTFEYTVWAKTSETNSTVKLFLNRYLFSFASKFYHCTYDETRYR